MTSILWAQLSVADTPRQVRFYQEVLGLETLRQEGDLTVLGAQGRELLHLVQRPAAQISRQAQPGLFHLAFLLPAPADLGAWMNHVSRLDARLEGAADHGVSQAIYLSDPEGNGLEVYADRPPQEWPRSQGRLNMFTRRLDLDPLLRQANVWRQAPAETRLGHIHLCGTSPVQGADYLRSLHLEPTCSVPGAEFYGWDGYHHHFAVNAWNVGPRLPGQWTGLSGYALAGPWTGQQSHDPWGHEVWLYPSSASGTLVGPAAHQPETLVGGV